MPIQLTDRDPRVPADRLVGELVPPPRFADVSFDSYRPDPAQPSQQQAVDTLRTFAATVGQKPRRRLFGRAKETDGAGGVYLDGGYGVGKTHLLASLWHAVPGPKLFATFVELTGQDHFPWLGDADVVLAATREHLAGRDPRRVAPPPSPTRKLAHR